MGHAHFTSLIRSIKFLCNKCSFTIHKKKHVTNFAILICCKITNFLGCPLADLGVVGTTADERCIGLLQNSAPFPGGVVCYSGVIPGSLAVYICNFSYHLEGPSLRECQGNGNWSGFVPQCVAG